MAKFCKNCGKELNPGQEVCLNCGARVDSGNGQNSAKGYCYNCGAELNPGQDVCLKCGVRVNNASNGDKSKMAAGLLGIFLGAFGVHNFYLGYTGKAVAQLLITCLSCGILSPISAVWGLIEGILIICGNITTDANGNTFTD